MLAVLTTDCVCSLPLHLVCTWFPSSLRLALFHCCRRRSYSRCRQSWKRCAPCSCTSRPCLQKIPSLLTPTDRIAPRPTPQHRQTATPPHPLPPSGLTPNNARPLSVAATAAEVGEVEAPWALLLLPLLLLTPRKRSGGNTGNAERDRQQHELRRPRRQLGLRWRGPRQVGRME